MAVAWATVALLVFLLPGFLFFVGIYFPEKFSRDSAPPTPLGQLAGTVLVAFIVHSLGFVGVDAACRIDSASPFVPPCPELEYILATFQLHGAEEFVTPRQLAAGLEANLLWILAYVSGTSAAGAGLGAVFGFAIVRGWLSFLAHHNWVHKLALATSDNAKIYTFAYVLTNVKDGARVVLYAGSLRQFALTREGRFAYLVLVGCQRGYMIFTPGFPSITKPMRLIGGTDRGPDARLFVIEGEDVANVVFEKHAYRETPISDETVKRALRAVAERAVEPAVRPPVPPGVLRDTEQKV